MCVCVCVCVWRHACVFNKKVANMSEGALGTVVCYYRMCMFMWYVHMFSESGKFFCAGVRQIIANRAGVQK